MKYVHISSFVFKKDVFNSKYFLKHFCDDTGLLFSILCFGKVHYEPFIGFSYRQREKSIMHEADMLELYLLELLLMQDCLDVKKMRSASLSRFFRPLKHCYRNKSELTNIRYKKYIDFGLGNSNIAITPLVNWNEISMASKFSFYMFYVTAIFSYIFFKVVRKTEWLLLSGGRK